MLNKEASPQEKKARHEKNAAGVRTRLTAGCVPYRIVPQPQPGSESAVGTAEQGQRLQVELLLITARKRGDWIFPKGGWEAHETSEEAALRETREEAGVCGNIVHSYPPFEFVTKKGRNTRMHYYLLQVAEILYDYPEAHQRRRKWFPLSEVDAILKRVEYQTMLDVFVASQPRCFANQRDVNLEDTAIRQQSSTEDTVVRQRSSKDTAAASASQHTLSPSPSLPLDTPAKPSCSGEDGNVGPVPLAAGPGRPPSAEPASG